MLFVVCGREFRDGEGKAAFHTGRPTRDRQTDLPSVSASVASGGVSETKQIPSAIFNIRVRKIPVAVCFVFVNCVWLEVINSSSSTA